MNMRERFLAVLNYRQYDRLPVVHFGYWQETLDKWHAEGHIGADITDYKWEGSPADLKLNDIFGFDMSWSDGWGAYSGLMPVFKREVLEENPEKGFRKVLNEDGAVILEKPGTVSIPAEVDHLLKDRASWEKHYLPKLQYSVERASDERLAEIKKRSEQRERPLHLYLGSLYGQIRNWLGIEGISYLYAEDEDLYDEIINTVGELTYSVAKRVLQSGAQFDLGHFWEDICFKNGPLVRPAVFARKVGPHYRKITGLLREHGINLTSLDCDGKIDALLPVWLENGVNVMFPIEVGTWDANIAPWREKYGRELRGVGGMNKNVFAADYAAVDAEIERLKPLVAPGGYIPCPDHRIAPDARFENVQYYCERMRRTFG